MTQQTPVEWLISRINRTSYDKVNELIEQAKEMEKKQINNAFDFYEKINSNLIARDYNHNLTEQFYKETYGENH